MPSIYHSCNVQDEASEALGLVNQYMQEVSDSFDSQLSAFTDQLNSLLGPSTQASVIIGTLADWQVTWQAVSAGSGGNGINIQYVYLAPEVDVTTGNLTARKPYGEIDSDGVTVRLYLGVDATGAVQFDMATMLTKWFASTTGLSDLVTATLIGSGAGFPDPVGITFLSGGTSQDLKDAEDAGDKVAEAFGKKTYEELLRAVDVPVIQTEAEAAAYLEEGDEYVIVNGKLLIVDGTNLVGINKIYSITSNIATTRSIVSSMEAKLPTLLTTQQVSTTVNQFICGEVQPITTISEVYRDLNTNVFTSASKWSGGIGSLNHYVFWGEASDPSMRAYETLRKWGFPDDYITFVLDGTDAEETGFTDVSIPETYTVEDLSLLDDLGFTDAELIELLGKGVDGVRIPSKVPVAERLDAVLSLLRPKPLVRDNGTTNKTKAPIAFIQSVDLEKVMDSKNLSTELAVRGKACARLQANFDIAGTFQSVNLPSVDLPNLSFDQLPNPAKKIESAYAALGSGIETANRTFDKMVGSLTDSVSSILNKIQNVSSLADNLFGNGLAECLLGTGSDNTGLPEFSGLGGTGIPSGTGVSSIPSLENVLGGLPIPKDLLGDALKKLSVTLDETITDSFSALMQTLQIPMCFVQELLNSINGIDLGGLTNPCKDGSDSDNKCPPEDIQEVIDSSTEMTQQLSNIPLLEGLPTTNPVETVEETVTKFTGSIEKTVTETTSSIDRGISSVLSDLQNSVESKLELVNQLDKAVKELLGDVREQKDTVDEENTSSSGCLPPVLGLFTDSIVDQI